MRFLRLQGISIFFGAILLASLIGQSFAGQHQFNAEAIEHHSNTYTWLRYVTSSEFGGDVLENWQSEFLQFFLYIFATVWLLKRGSTESKGGDAAGLMTAQSRLVAGHWRPNPPDWGGAGGARESLDRN